MIQNMINCGLNGLEINVIDLLVSFFGFFLVPINLVLQYLFFLFHVILTSIHYFRMEAYLPTLEAYQPVLETNQHPQLTLQ